MDSGSMSSTTWIRRASGLKVVPKLKVVPESREWPEAELVDGRIEVSKEGRIVAAGVE